MRICAFLLLAATLMVGGNTPARAGWDEFWAEFDLHRRRVEAWPDPFVIPDREAVRDPFRIMADNGWKQHNTFNDEWFNKENNELSLAGKIKLRQMLNEFPPHRRQVFVLEGQTQDVTSVRVASVYKCLAEIAPDQQPCNVLTTRIPAPVGVGWLVQGVYRSTALRSNVGRTVPGTPSSNSQSTTPTNWAGGAFQSTATAPAQGSQAGTGSGG